MQREVNRIRLFHFMTSATFLFVIAEIASAADAIQPLPSFPPDRVLVIGLIVFLMVFLFICLFWWWQKVEQSSYFGILFQDTIEFNETSRLRAPIDKDWERGTYLNEIFRGETLRGEQWVAAHERPLPSDELSNLARELDREYEVEGIKRIMEIPEIGMVSGGGTRIPGSGDGFSIDPWLQQVTGETAEFATRRKEIEEKKKEYFQQRREFRKKADEWVRKAQAWAHQRYEEDLEKVKKLAAEQAKRAMGGADFSAIRGRGPEFVLEFTAVVVIIFAAVILGVGGILTNEQIGTLLAAIAGYVLGKATTRGSSAQVQVVSDKTSEQKTGGANRANESPPKEDGNKEDGLPPKGRSNQRGGSTSKENDNQVNGSAPKGRGNQGGGSTSKENDNQVNRTAPK
jgi:hypothetical protein